MATAAVTQAKNSDSRRGGFSPAQWVLGRQTRLPATLCDDDEVGRLGAQALAATPGTKMFRKTQLRMAAREAFAQASNSDALRRAELRKIRPSRGPFPIGSYVFYFDAAEKEPGPNCWRGIARVVGREGSRTIWVSHRGILIAVSPEHLSRAYDPEVESWMAVNQELELVDTVPVAGGTGFIDLRKAPLPELPDLPEGDLQLPQGDDREDPEQLPDGRERGSGSSRSLMAREESERDASRARKSSEFFVSQEKRRKKKREERKAELAAGSDMNPIDTPVDPGGGVDLDLEEEEFGPELHDYHQAAPRRQLTPVVEDPAAEAAEREAKWLKVSSSADYAETFSASLAAESDDYVTNKAAEHYERHEFAYQTLGIDRSDFLFGVRRNVFSDKYEALAAQGQASGEAVKKKARKEIKLAELGQETQRLFTAPGGSDEREWGAWKSKEACEVLSLRESQRIRQEKPDLVIPTWHCREGVPCKVAFGCAGVQRQVPGLLQERCPNSFGGSRERLPRCLCKLQVHAFGKGHQECLL